MLLKGTLKLNSNEISMKKVNNIRVTVDQMTGSVITSSNTYEFPEWKDNREQLV